MQRRASSSAGLPASAAPTLALAADKAVLANAHGAVGDGKTLNTKAIQAAIDDAAKTGATIAFKPGVYLTGSLFLKSGVTLRLDKGVTILGSQNLADYPELPTRVAGIELTWPAALINVYKQKNVRIVGDGTVDGDGKVFWDSYRTLRRKYDPKGLRWAADYDCKRPRLIQIFDREKIELAGPRLRRAGLLTVHVCYSHDIHIADLNIRNNEGGRGPSTDGVDIDPRTTCWSSGSTWPATTTPCASRPAATPTACAWPRPTYNVTGPRLRDPRRLGRRHLRQRDLGRLPRHQGLGPDRAAPHPRRHPVQVGPHPRRRDPRHRHPRHAPAGRVHGLPREPELEPQLQLRDHSGRHDQRAGLLAGDDAARVVRARPRPPLSDVRVSDIKAIGAKTAFEAAAFPEAPLERFAFDKSWTSTPRRPGRIANAKDWTFKRTLIDTLDGKALEVVDSTGAVGLEPRPAA